MAEERTFAVTLVRVGPGLPYFEVGAYRYTAEWLPEAIALYERCGFVRDPQADLQASVLMPVPQEHDYVALAYRLDLADDGSR